MSITFPLSVSKWNVQGRADQQHDEPCLYILCGKGRRFASCKHWRNNSEESSMSLGDALKMMEIVGSTGFSRKASAAEAFRLKPVLPTISKS
jgi:hypothetical protein